MSQSTSRELLALQEAVAGRYFVEREVGRGGMGVVYLARDLSLERMVAIKLLPPDLAASRDLRSRFLREARTAAQLSHPHIVPIHAVEEHDAIVFFVMGYVDGETLGARVRRHGPLGNAEAMRLMQEVAWALSHAHARGVVHRDVKPDNILLERETGRALVTDFGIARASVSTTPAGGVTGTPQYMSPEQASGEEVDGRSDLYSLGATFFFALTGRLPIEAPSASVKMLRLLTDDALPVASVRAVVEPNLAQAIDRCLQRAPEQRFASATELAESLRTALEARPETPSAIRKFLAEVDAAGSEAGTASAAALTSVAVLGTSFGFNDFLAGVVFYTIAGVTGSLAVIRLARLTGDARQLLASGYGVDAVRRAVAIEEREAAERRHEPPHRWRAVAWLASGALVAAGAVAVTKADIPTGLTLVSAAASVVAPAIAIRRAVREWFGPRAGLRRLLGGRVGGWIFGAANVGMREPVAERALPGEPTVVAVARAADRLYAALPPAQRRGLGDVHGVISRLEAEALALRVDGKPTERHASALAALDALRLDLLRLSTAGEPPGELTRHIAEADDLGRRIDARLAETGEPTPR